MQHLSAHLKLKIQAKESMTLGQDLETSSGKGYHSLPTDYST